MKLQKAKLSGTDAFTPGSATLVINFGGPTVIKDKSFIQVTASVNTGGTYPNSIPYEYMIIYEFSSVTSGNAAAITFTRGPSVDADTLEITWRVFELAQGNVEHIAATLLTSTDQNIPIPAGKWTDGKSFIIANFYTTFTTWGTNLDPQSFQARHVNITSVDYVKIKGLVSGSEYASLQIVTLPNATIKEIITSVSGTSSNSAAFTAIDQSNSMHFSTFLSTGATTSMNETHSKRVSFLSNTQLVFASFASKTMEAVTYIVEDPDIFAQHAGILWFNSPNNVVFGTSVQEEHSLININGQVGYWGSSSSTSVLDFARWGMRNVFDDPFMMTNSFDLFRGSLSGLECRCQITVAEFTLDPSPTGHDQFMRRFFNNRRA